MNCEQVSSTNSLAKRLYWSTILVALGGVLLAKNFGLLPFALPAYLFSWKMLLVVLGGALLVSGKLGGLFPLAIGTIFLLPELAGIQLPPVHKLWPLLLIVIGVATLFKRKERKHELMAKWRNKLNQAEDTPAGFINSVAIFGGESRKVAAYDFKGGNCTAVFGGMELDLSTCYLSNEKAVLDVTVVCGGISIRVPKEWNVRSEVVCVLAGVEDKIVQKKGIYVDPAAELVLKGTLVMGGIEIVRE